LLPIVITLPLAWFWLKEPDRKDAQKHTQHSSNDGETTVKPLVGMWLPQAVRDRCYWTISIAMVMVAGASMLMVLNIVPLLQDMGFSAMEASQMLGALAGSLVAGRIIVGYLVDRFWAPAVACVAFLLPAIGCLTMLLTDNTLLLI